MVRVVRGAAIAVFAVASQEDGCTPAFEDPSGNPFGCCPFLEEVECWFSSDPKTCSVRYPPAGQEYAQCRGRPERPYSVVEECNAGLDCHNYDCTIGCHNSGEQFGFCVEPQKQVQFANGVGCAKPYGGCCNTCPDGYEPILDVKVCAAAAEFFSHSLISSCTYETLPWKSKVQEINVDRSHPFGCASYAAAQSGGCSTVAVNNNTQADMSDCGNDYDTGVYCQLSNASGSDFTV